MDLITVPGVDEVGVLKTQVPPRSALELLLGALWKLGLYLSVSGRGCVSAWEAVTRYHRLGSTSFIFPWSWRLEFKVLARPVSGEGSAPGL